MPIRTQHPKLALPHLLFQEPCHLRRRPRTLGLLLAAAGAAAREAGEGPTGDEQVDAGGCGAEVVREVFREGFYGGFGGVVGRVAWVGK